MIPRTSTIDTAKPIRRFSAPARAGQHRTEQCSDVGELVEARDDLIDLGRIGRPREREPAGGVQGGVEVDGAAMAGRGSSGNGRSIGPRTPSTVASVTKVPPVGQTAWKDDTIGRPYRCSTVFACMLLKASTSPSARPWTARPAMNASKREAVSRVVNPHAATRSPSRTTTALAGPGWRLAASGR